MTISRNSADGFGETIGQAPGERTTNPSIGHRAAVLPRSDKPSDPVGAGRFEALRKLGEGGMGEVALVRDHDIGRTVALKRPLKTLDASSLQRFAREVRTVGKLEHPSIVPIHDVGIDDDGRHYFVMKYVEGETLAHVIARLAAGDPTYVARYSFEYRTQVFTQLLYAMKYAHARGVIHRDIKPENVMVGPYGEVMLMDWGIARELDGGAPADVVGMPSDAVLAGINPFHTTAGSILGTPAYMSPEQARGDIAALDERSDIYSLCVLFHELLTARHYLHNERTTIGLLTAIASGDDLSTGEWLSLSASGVPVELVHFLRFGLRRRPADRYPSIDAMLGELASIRDGRVPIRCHLSFLKRVTGIFNRAINMHPAVATVGITLTAGAALVGIYSCVRALIHVAGG